MSGRSSAYGETVNDTVTGRSETSSVDVPTTAGTLTTDPDEHTDIDADTTNRLVITVSWAGTSL